MSLQDRMSVKMRMVGTFVFIAIMLAAFGVLTLREMSTLADLTETMHRHPLQVSNAALKAQGGVVRMHRDMKDVTLSKDEFELLDAVRRVQAQEKLVYEELDIVRQFILGNEGKELEAEARAAFAAWKPIRLRVQALIHDNMRQEAARITKEEGAEHVNMLERKMNALASYARAKADGFLKEANEVENSISRNTVLVLSLLIASVFILSFIFVRHIVIRLGQLQDSMTEITSSGELVNVEIPGDNEITDLGRSFNELISSLKLQFWLREGLNTLNAALSGAQTLPDIGEAAISDISRHLGACAGAIYTHNAAAGASTILSSYALVERRLMANSFLDGHGLVGQVVKERKPILLTNIAPHEAAMEAGTTTATANSVFASPMMHNSHLLGVLEVASLTKMNQTQMDFLEAAGGIIATAMHSVIQRERIDSLFIETNRANKELEIKGSELEALNSKLAERNEELNSQALELQHLAEELTMQKNELEKKSIQVAEADRLKSEFLSNMSHELRTPLNSILALSQLMQTKGTGKDAKKESEYLSIIERNGSHLLSLINDILDLSKIESGRMDITLASFSPDEVINEVLQTMSPLADKKDLELTGETPFTGTAVSDRDKVKQILINLVSNAVKFTESGTIRIAVAKHGGKLNISVTDTGIGIDSADIGGIFDQFRQVDGSTTRLHEGTGLGLAICKKLAHLLGGDLEVSSELGQGSEFTLVLPFKEGEEQRPAPAPAIQCKDNAVLVVDDNPTTRTLIATYLRQVGYSTLEAEDGKTALKMARENDVCAITLDIIMPELDGWEVLRQLKLSPQTRDIPVVVVSVSDDQTTGMALGANGYVVKPVQRERLLDELHRIGLTGAIKRVLVVDDDTTLSDYLMEVLEDAGYIAASAPNGKQGLKLAHEFHPDVMLLDLMMPEMDGFQVLDAIRQDKTLANLPVLVVTAKDLSQEEKRLLLTRTRSVINKSTTDLGGLFKRVERELDILSSEPARGSLAETKPFVLVVEDNAIAAMQISMALEEAGCETRHIADGLLAMETVKSRMPDLVIMDLMMPEIDGFEVLNTLRAHPESSEIPVVVLTAKELTDEDLRRLNGNNVSHIIRKGSLDRTELRNKVLSALDKDTSASQPEKHPRQGASLKDLKGTILVVEDNEDNLATLHAVLDDFGGELAVARDGESALRMAQDAPPALVLMDIQLPGMSGLEATRKLRGTPSTKGIPIIALTARAMAADREEILAAGCDDLVTKPYAPETLRTAITQWLRPGRPS